MVAIIRIEASSIRKFIAFMLVCIFYCVGAFSIIFVTVSAKTSLVRTKI